MQTTPGASLSDATNDEPGDEVRPRRVGVLILVAVAALVIDIVSKVVVVAQLGGKSPVELLGGLLTLRVLRNSGAAFSIGGGMTIVFTVIAIGVVIAILRTARRLRSIPWAVVLGLLLGGATGNLTDRIFRSPGFLQGHVVDWIDLPHWPVFNLADSAIVCGGVLAVILAGLGLQLDGTRASGRDGKAEATGSETEPDPSVSPDPGEPESPSSGRDPDEAERGREADGSGSGPKP